MLCVIDVRLYATYHLCWNKLIYVYMYWEHVCCGLVCTSMSHRVLQQQAACRVRSYSEGQRHSDVIEEEEQQNGGCGEGEAGGIPGAPRYLLASGAKRAVVPVRRKLSDIQGQAGTYRTEYMPCMYKYLFIVSCINNQVFIYLFMFIVCLQHPRVVSTLYYPDCSSL